MSDNDLFIILKAILWYSPNVNPLPTDEEIMKFIHIQKERLCGVIL